MTDRDYERAERRRRTREKGKITSIIAVGVIVLALIAIIVVVVAVISKNQPAAVPEATETVTEQPTLYVPSTSAPTPTERATSAAAQPTSASYEATEAAWDDQDDSDDDNSDETPDTSNNSASAVAGALHYYAYGGTSGGYNWTYDSMGDTAVTCQYDFDENKYDFTITGVSPGETSLTLIYYAADDQPVEIPLSVRVNDDLSVDLL
jgi:cytoskeletal protein RodZ